MPFFEVLSHILIISNLLLNHLWWPLLTVWIWRGFVWANKVAQKLLTQIISSCSEGHIASCSQGHFLNILFGRTLFKCPKKNDSTKIFQYVEKKMLSDLFQNNFPETSGSYQV